MGDEEGVHGLHHGYGQKTVSTCINHHEDDMVVDTAFLVIKLWWLNMIIPQHYRLITAANRHHQVLHYPSCWVCLFFRTWSLQNLGSQAGPPSRPWAAMWPVGVELKTRLN